MNLNSYDKFGQICRTNNLLKPKSNVWKMNQIQICPRLKNGGLGLKYAIKSVKYYFVGPFDN